MSEGEFHIWLPLQEFLEGEVYFLEADPNTTARQSLEVQKQLSRRPFMTEKIRVLPFIPGEGILEVDS